MCSSVCGRSRVPSRGCRCMYRWAQQAVHLWHRGVTGRHQAMAVYLRYTYCLCWQHCVLIVPGSAVLLLVTVPAISLLYVLQQSGDTSLV